MVAIMLAEGFKEHCVTLHQVLLNCGRADKTIKCKYKGNPKIPAAPDASVGVLSLGNQIALNFWCKYSKPSKLCAFGCFNTRLVKCVHLWYFWHFATLAPVGGKVLVVWWDGQLEVHQIAQQLFNLFASSDAQLKGMDNRLGLQRKGKLES